MYIYLYKYTGIGNAMQEDITHFLSKGATRVLIKPVDTAILKKTFKGTYVCTCIFLLISP